MSKSANIDHPPALIDLAQLKHNSHKGCGMPFRSMFISLILLLSLHSRVQSQDKLIGSADLIYLGAFRVPADDMGGPRYQGLAYGGSAIAYHPNHNSLFIVGHDQNQQVAEISIPDIINSSNINDLRIATVLQPLVDITEGHMPYLNADGSAVTNGSKLGGLLLYDNKVIGSIYAYYDGGHNATKSHFRTSLSLSTTGDFEGIYEVGNKPVPVPQAGFIAGYMTPIPNNWQSILGGKVLTGMSALSILGRTSSGPAAFAFDPSQLGPTPAPAIALLYYPLDHQTIDTYYTSRTSYNKGTHHSGVVFPAGTRSILFFGRQGIGDACYGFGTNIASENGNRFDYAPPKNICMGAPMTDTANPCCYDPVDLNKGAHAYPYVDYVWAYDANDLARVKAGGRIVDNPSSNLVDSVMPTSTETYKPWHIKPYAQWQIHFPTQQLGYSISSGAAAYDEAHKRLYLVQVQADGGLPIIHAFNVNITGVSRPEPPRNTMIVR
jgi:hypothetical protein